MHARPVLLIDADAAWCERVCRFLEPHGLSVITASTTAAARDALDPSLTPTAVLFEPATMERTFDRVRDLPELDGVPMFAVSAAAADEVYAKGTGVTGYVRKSLALQHLMLLLDDVREPRDRRRDAAPEQVA
jgi:DNA-binding response OmpR family regulator